ncbi:MAG: hypothetical protein J6S90_08095 [Lentisphaeria bacterium]|nr:hypothetical protein [Lentisphaeria bacterium]
MNRKVFPTLLAALAAVICGASPQTIPLDWHPTWKADAVYEVEIDRAKLHKLAGTDPECGFTVISQKKGKNTPLKVTLFPGAKKNSVALRFTVPAGTEKLFCTPGKTNSVIRDAVKEKNLFSGALQKENIKKWTAPANVTVAPSKNGIIFSSRSYNTRVVKYIVDVPAEAAGMPVKFELDVRSLSGMTWSNKVTVLQLDAKGRELSENAIDPRGASHMRPPQVLSQYRVEGRLRPDVKKLALVFELRSTASALTNHGLPAKNASALLPKLEVSRIVMRAAELLPFPKLNDKFFTSGVSGNPDDLALSLNDGRTFFYQTRSRASWDGTNKEITNPEELLYPAGDATIEAWIKPQWNTQEKDSLTIFNACHHLSKSFDRKWTGKHGRSRNNVFDLKYVPAKQLMSIHFVDWNNPDYSKSFKVTSLKHGQFNHIAVQYAKGSGVQVFINGKKVFDDPKFTFTAVDVARDSYPNHRSPHQFTVGQMGLEARNYMIDKTVRGKRCPVMRGTLDLLRISSVKRYAADFTPAKSFAMDKETRALFTFDRTLDGTTPAGLKHVPGTCHAAFGKFDNRLSVGDKVIDYYPAKMQDDVNPAKVLKVNNYPVMPKPADFHAARKTEQQKFSITPGKTKVIELDFPVHMDYVEIANNSGTTLELPLLIRDGEIDARSFGDIRDSLKLDKLPPKERVNKIFQFVLSASNYFMNHQATFIPGTDTQHNVEYQALMMLNGYCGFECGPMNNLTATLFSAAGYCPATQTAGYGHSFQQVFYDGSNRLYDLSNETFFPSFRNDQVASLEETEFDVGVFQRIQRRSDHFIRLGTRNHGVQVPAYQKKVGYTLNPGEKFRYYFHNNMMVNDLQSTSPGHVNFKNIPMATPYAKETHAQGKNQPIYRVDRFFPHYANGFLTFNGKPEKSNPAFKNIAADSFCYQVENSYPIVYGEYQAILADGSCAALEISTDRGKTFRPLKADSKGLVKAVYEVRARREYLIRVKAPINKVAKFKASTEVMMNPRLLTSKLKKGKNSLLFKAVNGKSADITLQYRRDVKQIKLGNVYFSGIIPGNETTFCAVEPGKSVTVSAENLSAEAKVFADAPLTAKLEGKNIIISSPADAKSTYAQVTIKDGDAERYITVLTAKGVRLSSKVVSRRKSRIASPGADLVQTCAVLNAKTYQCVFEFPEEIPAGEYYVFTLRRMDTYPDACPLEIQLPNGKWHAAGKAGTTAFDFYDTQIGDGRANFKWDYPTKYRYPYLAAKEVPFSKPAKSIILSYDRRGRSVTTEAAAIMLIPTGDQNLLNETIKILNGFNCNPFLVNKNNALSE